MIVIAMTVTLFKMVLFGAAYVWGWIKKSLLPKICHTNPTMVKLGTAILYLKEIQNISKSRDTPFEY